ncbi:MAG: hypothetical protein NC911_07995, partial [Candidatus Omnitrophica bacterium]|nr:hypothetical protein [Candidatus Omnitrophota bacterium]
MTESIWDTSGFSGLSEEQPEQQEEKLEFSLSDIFQWILSYLLGRKSYNYWRNSAWDGVYGAILKKFPIGSQSGL